MCRDYVDKEGLMQLCIRLNWFTCGSNRQYDKLFELADHINSGRDEITVKDLAIVIWVCSDTDLSIDYIVSVLESNVVFRR